MKFDLSKLQIDNVMITNTDEAFIGTPLADSPFLVEVKRLTKVEKINVASKSVDEDGNINGGEYSRELFVTSIANVADMIDENNEPLTIENGIREIIWEFGNDTLINKIKAVIENFNTVDEKKSDEQENDLNPTHLG